MRKMIDINYIESLSMSHKDRFENYLKHYGKKKFTIIEFLELENITWQDKKWVVFHENQKILSNDLLRKFALICACRAVENCDSQEIKDYFHLVLNIFISKSEDQLLNTDEYKETFKTANRAAYNATYSATDWETYCAAYNATYWAANKAANKAAYNVADWATYKATYWATEENIQRDILVNLLEELK